MTIHLSKTYGIFHISLAGFGPGWQILQQKNKIKKCLALK
jgi:hypothetical protein